MRYIYVYIHDRQLQNVYLYLSMRKKAYKFIMKALKLL
jgi:hypothetical protein